MIDALEINCPAMLKQRHVNLMFFLIWRNRRILASQLLLVIKLEHRYWFFLAHSSPRRDELNLVKILVFTGQVLILRRPWHIKVFRFLLRLYLNPFLTLIPHNIHNRLWVRLYCTLWFLLLQDRNVALKQILVDHRSLNTLNPCDFYLFAVEHFGRFWRFWCH